MIKLKKIEYKKDLNSRQKENHNFQVVSSLLAQYGYATLRLNDDWNGADFIAIHIDGKAFIRVQLKSTIAFAKKYMGKNIYITAPCEKATDQRIWFLYPHDRLLKVVLPDIKNTKSWKELGLFSWPTPPEWLRRKLDKYCIGEVSFKTN